MKVYIDLIFLLNFIIDIVLLKVESLFLKININYIRLILSSLIGEVTTIFLFLPISIISTILLKLLVSIIMIITAFKYHDFYTFRKRFITFYILSIILGGIVYFFKENFINNRISYLFFLLFIGPYLLYLYIKYINKHRFNISLKHKIDVYLDNNIYTYSGYLDTGNKLVDQYKKRPIILIYDKRITFTYLNSILVPYKTVSDNGILRCIKPDKVIIDDRVEFTDILIGESRDNFNLEEVDAILPNIIKEEL